MFRFVIDYVHFVTKIRKNSVDLIHLNPSLGYKSVIRDGFFLIIAKVMGKKVVVFFHGWNDTCEKRIRRYFLFPFRLIYSRADAIVVLALVFKKRLVEMQLNRTIFTETTTIDDDMFEHAAPVVESRRRMATVNKFNILFLSRIEREKGIYEALEVYRLLKIRNKNISMTVVGDGSELERVREYVADQCLKDVTITGFRTGVALRESYADADVYLFPTRHGEGFPISIIEAMTYGLPILTCPVGGIHDFFEENEMGFLRDSCDFHEWVSLLEQLIQNTDMRMAMGEYNHQYAQEHFRPGEVVRRLEGIYHMVLAGSCPP